MRDLDTIETSPRPVSSIAATRVYRNNTLFFELAEFLMEKWCLAF
jgi:hypothetical protein